MLVSSQKVKNNCRWTWVGSTGEESVAVSLFLCFYLTSLLIYGIFWGGLFGFFFLLIGNSGEILSVYELDQTYVFLRSENNQLQIETEHGILVEILATKSTFLPILVILDHNLPDLLLYHFFLRGNHKLQFTCASLCPSFVSLKDISKPFPPKPKKKSSGWKASIIWACLAE